MARYRIVSWRDIPSLVEAFDGDGGRPGAAVPALPGPHRRRRPCGRGRRTPRPISRAGPQGPEAERPGSAAGRRGRRWRRSWRPASRLWRWPGCGPPRADARRPPVVERPGLSPIIRATPMKATERIVASFLLFAACLVWPLLAIANRPVLVLGVPALVALPVRAVGGHRRRARSRRRAGPAPGGRRVNWLSHTTLLAIVLGYLVFLFVVASAAEAFAPRLLRGRRRTLTYVLAASVYCTAWTFYGSVGLAANRGPRVPHHLPRPGLRGAALAGAPRQARARRQGAAHHLDLRLHREPLRQVGAARGTLVAVLVVCGHDPVHRAPAEGGVGVVQDDPPATSRCSTCSTRRSSWRCTLALFGILFGARNLDFTKHQTGLMTAVAVESIVKLVAFLVVGRLRDVGALRRLRRPLRPHRRPPRVVPPARPRRAAGRLLRAVDGRCC